MLRLVPPRWARRRRHLEGLARPPQGDALDELAGLAGKGTVVLLYSARDEERNQAVVLRDALLERRRGTGPA